MRLKNEKEKGINAYFPQHGLPCNGPFSPSIYWPIISPPEDYQPCLTLTQSRSLPSPNLNPLKWWWQRQRGDRGQQGKGDGGSRRLDLPLPTLFFFSPSGPPLLRSTTPERRPAAFFILSQTSPLTV
jgi:hypothetical protein